jgi:hypothetical protein
VINIADKTQIEEEITMESLLVMTEETMKSVVTIAGPRSLLLSMVNLVS